MQLKRNIGAHMFGRHQRDQNLDGQRLRWIVTGAGLKALQAIRFRLPRHGFCRELRLSLLRNEDQIDGRGG